MMLWVPILLAVVLCVVVLGYTGIRLLTTVGFMLIPVTAFVLGTLYIGGDAVLVLFVAVILTLLFAK